MQTDVLIIGAGPAGCAAATHLARAGLGVVLADRQDFPRDKVCGDALIPDALAALARLGLADAVAQRARCSDRLRIYAPDGSHVDVPGRMACLPRLQLDALLHATAVAAGAVFLGRHELEASLEAHGRVVGARLSERDRGMRCEVRARHVLLATGAAAGPLAAFGVCRRRAASGVAARAYYRLADASAAPAQPLIAFDRQILPGYGWIFPGPDGVCNVGVGRFHDGAPAAANLRALWGQFIDHFPPAARLLAAAQPMTPLAGAPLRTALAGVDLSRPGLLVVGEAAGTTFAFSGEGIGKAMASALLAAECLLDAGGEAPEVAYPRRLIAAHGARYAAYDTAQRWLRHPRLCDWLARRARRGRFVGDQLAALLDESGDARRLFSFTGLVRAALG